MPPFTKPLFPFTVLIFAAIIGSVGWRVRNELRERFLDRYPDIIAPMAQLQVESAVRDLFIDGMDLNNVTLLTAMLENLRGQEVVAVQLFDVDGLLVSDFEDVPSEALDANVVETVLREQGLALYHSNRRDFRSVANLPASESVLEVLVPLKAESGDEIVGIARYFLDGQRTRTAFRAIDGEMYQMGVVALGAATALLALTYLIAGRLFRKNQRILKRREASLTDANRELAFVNKSSALGSMASHLIHGLRNPLAALQSTLDDWKEASVDKEELSEVRGRVVHMRQMIDELTQMLREETDNDSFEIDFEDCLGMLLERLAPTLRSHQVNLEIEQDGNLEFDNRRCNLLLLVLENLVRNAIDVTPKSGKILLAAKARSEGAVFVVKDTGPGLPNDVRERLFRPVASVKEGGSGIGLAITRHLVEAMGGEIRLQATGNEGTVFEVTVPHS